MRVGRGVFIGGSTWQLSRAPHLQLQVYIDREGGR